MTTGSLQIEGKAFAERIFDTVRRLSADTVGVTRQGYSQKETEDNESRPPRLDRHFLQAGSLSCQRNSHMVQRHGEDGKPL